MSVVIVVEGERFRIDTRTDPDGRQTVDLTWLTGPAGGTYGFSVGTTGRVPTPGERMTPAQIERAAASFVRAFFAEDGIGPADFPEFVAERRGRPGAARDTSLG